MNNTDNLVNLLLLALVVIVAIVVILIIIYIKIKLNSKKKQKQYEQEKKQELGDKDVVKPEVEYSKESIFNFMEFEKIEDNMIIQKKGKFLMVIECQGINYDLMSEMEKVSVEQGFLEFLNTLRYPIQLHVQTRTVNLEQSINRYKDKLMVIENKYNDLKIKYAQIQKQEDISASEVQKANYELVKQRNLYEYTKDIISNIEKTSLNNNVLNKKYYIILPYYKDEMETGSFSEEEIQNMAFSELYTRARAIMNSLFACQINGKILDSMGLIDLLYTAYNRDESNSLRADKALNGGFEDLYSTSPDIIEKKMKALDNEIQRKAVEYANQMIEETKQEREYRRKRDNLNNLVMELAKGMIEHEKAVIGENVATETIKNIEKKQKEEANEKINKKEGGDGNEKEKVQTRRRGRPRNV